MTTFLEYVNEWDELCALRAKLESQLAPVKAKELQMRKGIAESVKQALGDQLVEGVNNFPLGDGRTLKLTYKVDRSIAIESIEDARQAYGQLNDRPVEFDSLLRIKYELSKREFDKLGAAGKAAIADMIIAKPAAPSLEIR